MKRPKRVDDKPPTDARRAMLSVRIPPELDKRLMRYFYSRKAQALDEKLALQDLVAEAITEYLDKREGVLARASTKRGA